MSKQKKTTKPFHLTVTDNETGEVVRELDFDTLIGAARVNKQECAGVAIAKSSPIAHAETIIATETTIDKLTQLNPMVGLALVMTKASLKAEIEEPQNQEENEEKGE